MELCLLNSIITTFWLLLISPFEFKDLEEIDITHSFQELLYFCLFRASSFLSVRSLYVLIFQCLDRPDPPSDRPKLLHVQVRGFRSVDTSKASVSYGNGEWYI